MNKLPDLLPEQFFTVDEAVAKFGIDRTSLIMALNRLGVVSPKSKIFPQRDPQKFSHWIITQAIGQCQKPPTLPGQ
jgi:hypothetical protein